MQIKSAPMGYTQTNCYIVDNGKQSLIIDPGMGAKEWVIRHATNPIAILNTHGHFDHVYDNGALKEHYDIPIYCPKEDAFMLQKCVLGQHVPPSRADVEVDSEKPFWVGDFRLRFRHFPGHTPGCSVIELDDIWFSGDFLFKGSIGRWDFPYSDGHAMLQSLKRAKAIDKDFRLYPGHGEPTGLKREQMGLDRWIAYVQGTI